MHKKTSRFVGIDVKKYVMIKIKCGKSACFIKKIKYVKYVFHNNVAHFGQAFFVARIGVNEIGMTRNPQRCSIVTLCIK